MTMREHHYGVIVRWTGNRGEGTATYKSYGREHEITSALPGKPAIAGSSDPAFRGDAARWNPEELLVAAVSACHKLWYLHLAAVAGVVVTDYVDHAEGTMTEGGNGGGRFTSITLRPEITITRAADIAKAEAAHAGAHEKCFVANSLNVPVTIEPRIKAAG